MIAEYKRGPNPYTTLPDSAFWRKSVATVPQAQMDPVTNATFNLTKQDRIATAGSCFAQHVARHLSESGYNYLVTEAPHPFLGTIAKDYNYGTFSARYGNIYTSRQLLQLFDRAYNSFKPVDDIWVGEDGRYYDPFRPTIQPRGFSSEREYWEDRAHHLAAVRNMFEHLDVFVFTLGLTESWLCREDGAAFPLCPGVAAGNYSAEKYEYFNLSYDDVVADLDTFVRKLRMVNSRARVILTVSPVPLIATMEPRHVLVSTTYSKSVLRVACDIIERRFSEVIYYPAYEIITGNYARSNYYADDLRSVREEGVAHVMNLFIKHFGERSIPLNEASNVPSMHQEELKDKVEVCHVKTLGEEVNQVICDEEMLDLDRNTTSSHHE
jgi:hypothetical protein